MPKTSKKTAKKKVAKSKKSTSIKTKPAKEVKKVIVEEKKTKAPVKISKNYLPKELHIIETQVLKSYLLLDTKPALAKNLGEEMVLLENKKSDM